jgi:hypothetical protein
MYNDIFHSEEFRTWAAANEDRLDWEGYDWAGEVDTRYDRPGLTEVEKAYLHHRGIPFDQLPMSGAPDPKAKTSWSVAEATQTLLEHAREKGDVERWAAGNGGAQ